MGIPLLFTTIWGPRPSLILPEDCKQRCGPATDCLVTPYLPNEEVGEATFDGKQIGTILALVGHVWVACLWGQNNLLYIWMLAPARVTTRCFYITFLQWIPIAFTCYCYREVEQCFQLTCDIRAMHLPISQMGCTF